MTIELTPKNPSNILVCPSEQAAEAYLEKTLQKLWCKTGEKFCGCSSCRMVKQRSHHQLQYIVPEQSYKIEHIKSMLHITQFQRSFDESFVFVLSKAETLTTAVANRLLILFEEPPAGYYFILVTKNLQVMLPTIISRSFVHTLSESHDLLGLHPLCHVFTGMKLPPFQHLVGILKETKIDHQASKQYFDTIRTIHIKEALKHFDHQTSRARKQKIIATLNHFAQKLPRQGSSDLFWKLLYLSWPQ